MSDDPEIRVLEVSTCPHGGHPTYEEAWECGMRAAEIGAAVFWGEPLRQEPETAYD